jgi:hypothetical protein
MRTTTKSKRKKQNLFFFFSLFNFKVSAREGYPVTFPSIRPGHADHQEIKKEEKKKGENIEKKLFTGPCVRR